MYLKGLYYSNFENVFRDLAHFSHSLSQDSCNWLFRKNKRFKHKVGVTSKICPQSMQKNFVCLFYFKFWTHQKLTSIVARVNLQ